MNNQTACLTIIVPAFNVEKYLAQCIDSLIHQTVLNHRVIIVDDGSTDSTPEIADRYMREYPDIVSCIHQKNCGLGAARNRALSMVTTPYVSFLDSDDWQDRMFVERIVQTLSMFDENPDIIFTLPWIYDAVSKQVTVWYDKALLESIFFPCGGPEDVPPIVTNVKADRRLYELEASTNRRVYRTSFLKSIGFSFQEGTKWEDVQPHFHAIHNAQRCIAMKNTGFLYRINTGGQITAGGGVSRLDLIPVFRETLERAYSEAWDAGETAYIIRMMLSFSTWSIGVTNTQYIAPLLSGLHKLYRSIPNKYFKSYLKICSPQRKRDWVIIWTIKSPFYRVLTDYRVRNLGVKIANVLRRLLRR